MTRAAATLLLSTLLLAAGGAVVRAQEPYDYFRIIAPAAPGGGWDQTARAMQQVLQQARLVRTSSVENIPGAAGTIGLARFISAERGNGDVVMASGLIMLGAIVTQQSAVTLREVTPIARLTSEYEAVVVPSTSPIRTLQDLIQQFRARPESVSWGGGSAGGSDQILAGLIADAVGVAPRRVNYIAFAGGGESLSAILGGQVTVGINGLAEFAPQLAAGAVRVLAISSPARLAHVDAPTLVEQGIDIAFENWRSVVAPPGTSAADRRRLEATIDTMVKSPEWRAVLERFNWNDRYLAGEAFQQFVIDEEKRVTDILRKLGLDPATTAAPVSSVYAAVVLGAFGLLMIATVHQASRTAPREAATTAPRWRAVAPIAAGAVLQLVLLESVGFVLCATVLFWLTARGFNSTRPLRDLAVALTVSIASYVLFVHLLQLPLPEGVLAGWL